MTDSIENVISTPDHSRPTPAAPRRASAGRYLLLTGIVVLIVLGIIGTLATLKILSIQTSMAQGGWPEPANAVVVAQAVEQDWQPVISTTGTVMATRFATLQNEVEGTITEMRMTSGQVVEEGQLLLSLDTSVEAAELRAAQARQKLAEIRFERVKRNAANNAASADEMSEAQATLDAAIAASQQLQAVIDRKTIKAPFKATLGIVDLQKGQYLQQGTTIAALTGVDDHVFVDFAVPQEMAGRLPAGTPIQFFRINEPDTAFLATIVSDDMMHRTPPRFARGCRSTCVCPRRCRRR
jgi:membrane fusion protein, multidrug efflux system